MIGTPVRLGRHIKGTEPRPRPAAIGVWSGARMGVG
jgi:hypothetical protein